MPPRNGPSSSNRTRPITSFFKPSPQKAQPTPPPPSSPSRGDSPCPANDTLAAGRASRSSPTSLRAPSSPLQLPSSPLGTPSRSIRRPVARDAVVAASDEDDSEGGFSDSDDDLEDLMAKFDPNRLKKSTTPPLAAARKNVPGPGPGPLETPRAKRTDTAIHCSMLSSPLTLNPKRTHQFDMGALIEDAMQDDATHASSLKNRLAVEAAAKAAATASAAATSSRDAVLLGIVRDGDDGLDAQKVLRAVQRTSHGQSPKLRYCFFAADYAPPPPPPLPPMPPMQDQGQKQVGAAWAPLTHANPRVREQYLASGLPQTMVDRMGGAFLPAALFDWILDDLCVQKSRLVQQEYVSLLSCCQEHARVRLTPQRLRRLFARLGARGDGDDVEMSDEGEEGGGPSPLPLSNPPQDPYLDRDWSCVRSVIELLGLLSCDLSPESVAFATRTLLRMSVDRFLICSPEVLPEYEYSIQLLVEALPPSSWDSFCAETIKMMYANFTAQSIRINALLCLPISNRRTHELRRRLAVSFFFDDPTLGGHHPDTVVSVRRVIDRLAIGDVFAVTSKTDFDELRAGILLLNMAVDDGSLEAASATADGRWDPDDERRFNAEVDELATMLREIWRKINDAGMKLSRTEAKSVIEWVQQRISHSVRTRKKVRKSVFDSVSRPERDPFLPRQQNYMRKFLDRPVSKRVAS
ncbi:hypothetical protein GMORB2_5307 [Geosmithia morbida]|uniref:Uncharacterized protein n=1 Tax=Geosmithia morbida TaxID=1094350 RepID=A0A9P4YX15_9HYPO|nr:uncharacterized protein GMORB2_5307 [Geosmithia morbida]KAF4124641.1 hypothetical protein GMORB2_5307 [Geosmithia morbida]